MKRALRYGDYVKTADGAIGMVTYAGRVMDLLMDEGGDSLSLPAAELKRIPNPYRVLPAVEGVPAVRPACDYCAKPLAYASDEEREQLPNGRSRVKRRTFRRWRFYGAPDGSTGRFCTLSHAWAFARAAFLNGYRIRTHKRGK